MAALGAQAFIQRASADSGNQPTRVHLGDNLQTQQLAASLCANLSQWVKMTCNYDDENQQQPGRPQLGTRLLSLRDLASMRQPLDLVDLLAGQGCARSPHSSDSCLHQALSNSTSTSASPALFQHDQGELYFKHQPHSLAPLTSFARNYLVEPLHGVESRLDYFFGESWQNSGDERASRFPLMGGGPWKLILATLVYLLLIKRLLPRLMRHHQPLELNWPIRIYNLSMVLSNMWAFYHGARILNFGLKCFGCEVINHRDYSSEAVELLHYGWLFFMSRLVEWVDTVFFVLRKKERQVTKLHVFHHSFVPLISWTYLKYHPGYTSAFFPLVNTFVHSIMYTYYLLATFGPAIQPYLWWKRYLTSLQIAQFVLILIQLASIPLTGNDKCPYPRGFLYVAFAGAILFLWLFFTYYIDTYSKQKAGQRQRSGILKSGPGNSKQSFRSVPPKQAREGSSRALSDAIDNAIVSEEPFLQLYKRTSLHIKDKRVV